MGEPFDSFALRSDGGRRGLDGLGHASHVGDLDLVRFGLLGHGDSDREHAVVVDGGDVVQVQALAEEQLPAELAVGPLLHLYFISLVPERRARRLHAQEVVLDGQLDRAGVGAGQVELDLQLVASTVGIDWRPGGPGVGRPSPRLGRGRGTVGMASTWVHPLVDARTAGGL